MDFIVDKNTIYDLDDFDLVNPQHIVTYDNLDAGIWRA